ncbi:MAG: anthranilate synthase component family protein [Bacteroidota bacterium]|nr:anthranilate synthase component family protein [Bacteroidota bacterium]
MRTFYPFPVTDIETFKQDLLLLSSGIDHFCFLDSNNYPNYPYSTFGSFFAIDALHSISADEDCLNKLQDFQQLHDDWLFGFLSYDLKNEIEQILFSKNHDGIKNPLLHFFVPKYLVKIENNEVEIGVCSEDELQEFKLLVDGPQSTVHRKDGATIDHRSSTIDIQHRISKQEYISSVEKIKDHIQLGDIYEMNFCQEYYAEDVIINPLHVFQKLNTISKAPFTSYFKNTEHYLLCASPERFLKRQQNKLISQPIKGTRKRFADASEDQNIQQELFYDEKERSENIMIVDLVRNDLSRIALKNSVTVEELFGIYSFEQVHQMISTVTCDIYPETSFTDILKNTFPMGSMTGAPKIAAMELIEKFEETKRGLYSGAVGYITPKGNFDFNVVIRSIVYNAQTKYVSMQAGSAITIDCDAEKEYEECLVKSRAMKLALE